MRFSRNSIIFRGFSGSVVAGVFFWLSFVFEEHWVSQVLWVLAFASLVVVPTILYNLIKDRS